MRTRAEERTGLLTRPTRVYALGSRREGADSGTRVGERDPCTGEIVHAIFAANHGYTIIWEGGHVDLSERQIYEAIPLD